MVSWVKVLYYDMGHSNKIAFTIVLFAPSDKSWSIFIFCVWVVVSQCVCIYIIELFATKLTANILLSFFNMFHKQKSVQDIVKCYLEYTSQAVQKQAMKRCKFWWWTQSKNYFFQLCNNTWYAVFGFSPFIQIFKYTTRPGLRDYFTKPQLTDLVIDITSTTLLVYIYNCCGDTIMSRTRYK